MPSSEVSPLHSSSECSTAHLSRSSSIGDGYNESTAYAFPRGLQGAKKGQQPSTAATGTHPASDPYISLRGGQSAAERVLSSELGRSAGTPNSGNGRLGRVPVRKQRTSLPLSPASLVETGTGNGPWATLPPAGESSDAQRRNSEVFSAALPKFQSVSDANRQHMPTSPPKRSSLTSPPIRAAGYQESITGSRGGSSSSNVPPQQPAQRGGEGDSDTPGVGGEHSLHPPSPSQNVQAAFLAAVARQSVSREASLPMTPLPEASLSSQNGDDFTDAAQGSVRGATAEDGSTWWAAARRFLSDGGERISNYLESVVNPGGAAATMPATRLSSSQAPSRTPGGRMPANRSPSASSGAEAGNTTNKNINRGVPSPYPPSSPARLLARDKRAFYEPISTVGAVQQLRMDPESTDNFSAPLELVVIDPSRISSVWGNPNIEQPALRVIHREIGNDSFLDDAGSNSDVDAYDAGPDMYVVDLLSALRGYQSNPTEPFGHLVAAALASRSKEMPVQGFEVAAAEHYPYLVRLIVDSGTLDEDDPVAQREVQETMDEVIAFGENGMSPAIYEYLSSFFRMPFVRLAHRQYTLLKRRGFEYVKLMFDHQHVLPQDSLNSILINESPVMHTLNFIFMVLQLCAILFCAVSLGLVIGDWMILQNGAFQNFGFYSVIAFGAGWALYLIFLLCAMRSRQDATCYETTNGEGACVELPSPYVAVVPIVPLFDIFCIVAYARALRSRRLILGHNIVASSRISGIFYAMLFAFPQLISQVYFANFGTGLELEQSFRTHYILLLVSTTIQWSLALFGYAWLLFTHDSIDGFGFACFNLQNEPYPLERHNAVGHLLHYLMASILETNIYLIVAASIGIPGATCYVYRITTFVLSGITVLYIVVVYIVIVSTDTLTMRISFSSVPLLLLQIALIFCLNLLDFGRCPDFKHVFFRKSFVFGYLSWGAFFTAFLLWLVVLLQWRILYTSGINLFLRLSWPLAREDSRFSRSLRAKGKDERQRGPADASSPLRQSRDKGDLRDEPIREDLPR